VLLLESLTTSPRPLFKPTIQTLSDSDLSREGRLGRIGSRICAHSRDPAQGFPLRTSAKCCQLHDNCVTTILIFSPVIEVRNCLHDGLLCAKFSPPHPPSLVHSALCSPHPLSLIPHETHPLPSASSRWSSSAPTGRRTPFCASPRTTCARTRA
jgi:hypothetical protein